MNTQTSATVVNRGSQMSKSSPEKAQVQKEKETSPTFSTLKTWLVGREVTISAPPEHPFTKVYCPEAKQNESGHFTGKLLDLSVDQGSGLPIVALLEYRQRNARRYYQTDLIPVHGCSISVSLEIEREDDEEDLKN